jgi:hypothetical protein
MSAERLNELLDVRVSWVDELRGIRGKARLNWRILREVNCTMLSVPERLAYEAYHAVLDTRLWCVGCSCKVRTTGAATT